MGYWNLKKKNLNKQIKTPIFLEVVRVPLIPDWGPGREGERGMGGGDALCSV